MTPTSSAYTPARRCASAAVVGCGWLRAAKTHGSVEIRSRGLHQTCRASALAGRLLRAIAAAAVFLFTATAPVASSSTPAPFPESPPSVSDGTRSRGKWCSDKDREIGRGKGRGGGAGEGRNYQLPLPPWCSAATGGSAQPQMTRQRRLGTWPQFACARLVASGSAAPVSTRVVQASCPMFGRGRNFNALPKVG